MKHKGKVISQSNGKTFVKHYLKEDGTGHTIAFRDHTNGTAGDPEEFINQGPSNERFEREMKELQEKAMANMIPYEKAMKDQL
tara:strand:- start:452 stop:700 length:249 start_codon:yes stop_codon:yes gene_type:complete